MANLHEKSPPHPPTPQSQYKKNTEYLVLFGSCPFIEKHSQLFRPFLQSSEKHIIF